MNIYTIEADGVAVMVMSAADMGEVDEGIDGHIGAISCASIMPRLVSPYGAANATRQPSAGDGGRTSRSLDDDDYDPGGSWVCFLVPVFEEN